MTMTYAEHRRFLAIRDELLDRLREEMQHRDSCRGKTIGDEPAFVVHEAREMSYGVNRVRRQYGLSLMSLADVLQVERQAAGHIDYADKYALYCAELALGLKED